MTIHQEETRITTIEEETGGERKATAPSTAAAPFSAAAPSSSRGGRPEPETSVRRKSRIQNKPSSQRT